MAPRIDGKRPVEQQHNNATLENMNRSQEKIACSRKKSTGAYVIDEVCMKKQEIGRLMAQARDMAIKAAEKVVLQYREMEEFRDGLYAAWAERVHRERFHSVVSLERRVDPFPADRYPGGAYLKRIRQYSPEAYWEDVVESPSRSAFARLFAGMEKLLGVNISYLGREYLKAYGEMFSQMSAEERRELFNRSRALSY